MRVRIDKQLTFGAREPRLPHAGNRHYSWPASERRRDYSKRVDDFFPERHGQNQALRRVVWWFGSTVWGLGVRGQGRQGGNSRTGESEKEGR